MIKTSELIWQDTQHQMLFKYIDLITAEPFDRTILAKLHTYAEYHFVLEEAYMEALNDPDMNAHKNAHDRFRDELKLMVGSSPIATTELRESLALFLTEWLKRHVFGIDKKLEKLILDSKVK